MAREGRAEASDEDLVRAVAAGDRVALRELYERHSPWLLVRLRQRCADPTIVHDAIQDTFVAVWKGAARYDGRGTVAAWVWGIGIRRLIGQFRKMPRPVLPLRVGDDGPGADEVLISAEDLVLTQIEHGPLAHAINALSPELRLVVQATVLDGLTTREAAMLLGIPTGTVKTRMMRAKREMREALT